MLFEQHLQAIGTIAEAVRSAQWSAVVVVVVVTILAVTFVATVGRVDELRRHRLLFAEHMMG